MGIQLNFAKTLFETIFGRITRFKAAYAEYLKSDNYDWLANFPQGRYSQQETPFYESYSSGDQVEKYVDSEWNGEQSDFSLGKALLPLRK